jgi:O-antigen ligase
MLAVTALAAAASYGAFLYFDSLRDRFLSGDVSLRIGSVAINGSGRSAFWRVTVQSFEESPIFGKGAGTAGDLIDSYWSDIEHPHSDFLRVAHDYGVVGLLMWVTGLIVMLAALWRFVKIAEGIRSPTARLQMTAFLTLAAFVIQMTAENSLVYLFVAAPIGLVVGTALGSRRRGSAHRLRNPLP